LRAKAGELLQEATGEDLMTTLATAMETKRLTTFLSPLKEGAQKYAVRTGVVDHVYKAASTILFPPLWKVCYAKDTAIISFRAYGQMRATRDSYEHEPPRHWLQDYQKLQNEEAESAWEMQPEIGERHPILKYASQHLSLSQRRTFLSDHDVMWVPLRKVLQWQLYRAMADGADLAPFIIPVGDNVDIGGIRPLIFKMAFDTTITSGREMYMLGVIPHQFPSQHIQSARNVQVVALARLGETGEIIDEAHPQLAATVTALARDGLELCIGERSVRVRCEMHIAADLKALWLALGLPSFACPFCVALTWNETNQIHVDYCRRRLASALGVPPERVHLCALHANLRIVERLLKNSAMAAYDNDSRDRKHRVRKLREHLVTVLRRTKFVITSKASEVVGENPADLMEEDDVYEIGSSDFGENVTVAMETRVNLRLSSLTGPHAMAILREKHYEKIVELTENPCDCEERRNVLRNRRAHRSNRSRRPQSADEAKCKKCRSLEVWRVFAEVISPLLSSVSDPERLARASRRGRRKAELKAIKDEAFAWLNLYVSVYGRKVTPYVHIIGRHLHDLLGETSLGVWSQQGFEACHKIIRRLYGMTALGGSRARLSALRQVLRHLFRQQWGDIRTALEASAESETELGQAFRLWFNTEQAGRIDNMYSDRHPERDLETYVESHCASSLRRSGVMSATKKAAFGAINSSKK
jgi:hypothetical protein